MSTPRSRLYHPRDVILEGLERFVAEECDEKKAKDPVQMLRDLKYDVDHWFKMAIKDAHKVRNKQP